MLWSVCLDLQSGFFYSRTSEKKSFMSSNKNGAFMNTFYLVWTFFILFFTSVIEVYATSYYVALTGNNSNPGVIDQPFRTIKYAVSKVNPGDNIYVRGGDYRENFPGWDYGYIDGIQGTSSNPIIISAYQKEKPIFSKFTIKNCAWLVLDGFQITGYQPLLNNWKDLPEIIIDDQSVGAIDPSDDWSTRELKTRLKYATYKRLMDDFENSWNSGVTLETTHNCIIRNTDISKFMAGINLLNGSTNNQIQNNTIHHTVNAIFTWSESGLISAENSFISNNHFYQNFHSAVRLLGNAKGNIVENNLAEYSGIGHMDTHSGGSYNTFRCNRLIYSGYYAETMSNPGPSGISIHSAGPGNVVEGNYIAYQIDITGNDGCGIITDYTDYQTIVRNNILYRNMGHGFVSTYSGKGVIVHNVFVENGYSSDKHKFGIAMSRSVDVDHIIANNIFYKNKTGGMTFGGRIDKQKYIDYNLFYQPGTPIVANNYWDNDTHYYDLFTYRNATGFGTHSISSNPIFIDPDKENYHLSIHSSAIDAATTLHSTSNDKDWNPRPMGSGLDIGAYEYIPGSDSAIPEPPTNLRIIYSN